MKCPLSVLCLMAGLSIVIAARTNLSDVGCGRQSLRARRHGKIIGGTNAEPNEFPWLVSIKRSGGHFCGGTIVNRNWVLTAAHCLCSGRTILKAQQLKVIIGEHVLSGVEVPEEQEISVTKLILHPGYKCLRYVNDIALLELSSSVTWSDTAAPACFPPELEGPSFANKEAIVAGWGWTDENPAGLKADVLQKVKVTVVGNDQCNAWYKSQGKKVKVLNTQICAGVESGGKDSCWADSGGPLMVKNGGSMMVVGIVSTGIGCGRPRLPGLYTRISEYILWIRQTIV